MKCSYCEANSIYSVGWIDENGVSHDNYSCEEHFLIAKSMQDSALMWEEWKQRNKIFIYDYQMSKM